MTSFCFSFAFPSLSFFISKITNIILAYKNKLSKLLLILT